MKFKVDFEGFKELYQAVDFIEALLIWGIDNIKFVDIQKGKETIINTKEDLQKLLESGEV